MIYQTTKDWKDAAQKRVLFFGMSGLGKTHVSDTLRAGGNWFHYSVDYRIGTRYMSEPIVDACLSAAMEHPFLAEMLRKDALHLVANVHTHDLSAVSTYLGKPGAPERGGLTMDAYRRRQAQFKQAEIAALHDTAHFIDRAEHVYGYPHFICDTGGSICEWVDAEDEQDPILKALSRETLMVWIKGSEAHTQELIRRFDRAPKPMAYQPEFLARVWQEYLNEMDVSESDVDPDAFIRFTYAKALAHRQPRYEAMARWGVTVSAEDMGRVRDHDTFVEVIADAIEARRGLT